MISPPHHQDRHTFNNVGLLFCHNRYILSLLFQRTYPYMDRTFLCDLRAFARAFLAGYFFSPSRKGRKDLYHPLSLIVRGSGGG